MSYKLLISSLLVIVFSYGSNSVTLHPDLVKEAGSSISIMKGNPAMVKCFNKYWQIKSGFEAEQRNKWKCPLNNCPKDKECCAAYIVYNRVRDIKMETIKECGAAARSFLQKAMVTGLQRIQKQCDSVPIKQESVSGVCLKFEPKSAKSPLSGDKPTAPPPDQSESGKEPAPGEPDKPGGDNPVPDNPVPEEPVPNKPVPENPGPDSGKPPPHPQPGGDKQTTTPGGKGIRLEISGVFGLVFGLTSVLISLLIQ